MSDLVYTAMPYSMSYQVQTFYIATEFFSANVRVNLWDDTDDYSFYYRETGETQEDTNGATLKKLELRSKLNKVTLSNIVIKAAALTDNILYSNIILPDAIKLPKTFWVSATGFDGYYADDDSNNWVECPVACLGLDYIGVTAEISSQNTQTSLSEFLNYHSSITNKTRVRIPKYTEALVSPDYYNDSNFSKIIGVWWCANWSPLFNSRDSYIVDQTENLAPLPFGEGVDFYIDPAVEYFPMAIVPSSAQIHIEFSPDGNRLVLVSGIGQNKVKLTKLSALRPISSSYYIRVYDNDDYFTLSEPAPGVDAQIIDSIESVDISTTTLLSWLTPGFKNPADNPFFYITEDNKSSCTLLYYSGSENPTSETVASPVQLNYTSGDFGTLEYGYRLLCGPQDNIGDYALLNVPFIVEVRFESEVSFSIGKYAFSGTNISYVYTDNSYTYDAAYGYASITLQEGCFNELKTDQKTFRAPTLYEMRLDCNVGYHPTSLTTPCVSYGYGSCSLPYYLINDFGVNCSQVTAYTTDGYDPSKELQANQLGSELRYLQLYDLPCPSLGQNSADHQNLETVEIRASQIYLPDNALSNIDTLCEVYLNLDQSSSDSSVWIGSDAFCGCTGLQTFYLQTINTAVSSDLDITVGTDAFKSCPSLQTVFWPDLISWCNTTFIDEFLSNPIYATRHQANNPFDVEIQFSSMYELTDYNSVYYNSDCYPYSFYNKEIGTLVLSEDITKIPAYTFYKSNLKKLYIKSGSISIGDYALQDCYSLKQIIFDGTDTVTFNNGSIVNNCYQLSDIIYTAEKLSEESKQALISSFGNKIVHDQYTQNNLLYITEEETQNTFECTMTDDSIILLDIVQKPGSKTLTIPVTLSYNNTVWPCELTESSFIDIGSSGSALSLKTLIIDHTLYDLCFDNWTTQSGAQVILKANTKHNCVRFQELFNKPAATLYIEAGCEVPATTAFTNCYLDQDKVVYQQYIDDKIGLLYTVLKAINPQLSEYSICDTINDIPVTKISSNAFVDLTSLTKLVFPKYLTTLEENACVSLTALTELYINSNITTLPVVSSTQTWFKPGIGSNKFTVFFGDTVEAIPKYLFSKTAHRIQAVQFPDGLQEIGQGAFWQTYSLTDLSIPKNIKSIGGHAFCLSMASNAASVTLDFENSELYIGIYAFSGMTIDRLSIPELTAETYRKWARETELYDTTIKTISLPCELAKLIDTKAKNGEKLSTEIVELEFVSGERINTTYCLNWSKLQKLYFPASLKTITYFGKTHNNGLNIYFKGTLEDWTQISLPNYTDYYGPQNYNLYINDTLITDLTLPDTIQELKQHAFCGCTSLKTLDLNQVEVLGSGAFYKCKHLTTVTNSDKLQKIGTYAFHSTALTSFKIPESVTPEDLGTGIFYSCELHSLAVPNSIIKDSLSELINGTSTAPDTLDTLIITGTDTTWNTNFLSGCTTLKNLIWESQVPESFMKAAFKDCRLEKIVIPEDQLSKWCSIKFEDYSANPMTSASDNFKFFVGNNELTDLEWPLDSLNSYTFCSYKFNSITLPNTLKVDDANALNKTFYGCLALYCTMPSVSYALKNFISWSTQLQGLHLTDGTVTSDTLAELANRDLILQIDSNVSLTDESFPSSFRAKEIVWETRADDFILVDNIIYNDTKLLYASKSDLTTAASIKDTTTEIKNEAFKDCQYVQIALPYTVQSIGTQAFANCVNLQVLEIPGVTAIDDTKGLLENCSKLRELTISDFGNTETFGELFSCDNSNVPSQLTKLLINAGTIPDSYFNNCQKLRDVHLSFNVTNVGAAIFENCCFDQATNPEASIKIEFAKPTGDSLAPISSWNDNWADQMVSQAGAEDNIITWGVTISYLIDNLYYTFDTSNQTATITGLSTLFKTALKTNKTVELPETIQHTNKGLGTFAVAGIGDGVFASCSNLEQITLPAGLKLIGVQAFASCSKLRDIIFNTTHTDPITFNKNAFIGCANLTRVKLVQLEQAAAADAWATYQFENLKANPLAAPTLGCALLAGSNTNISELNLPNIIVNEYAFAGCNTITKVKVKGCSLGAFQNCLNIDTIEIGDGGIGEAAFKTPVTSNPRSISLTVTDNVIEISDFSTLFEGRKIGSFVGPTQILKAISDKSMLTLVKLTGGTESIDATIFSSFTNGELLVVEAEKLVTLELAADIPGSLITDAFSQCSKVQTIKAPISLLNNLNLTSCEDFTENSGTIIEEIPANSFENCNKLKLFTCYDTKVIGNNAFNGVATDFNIHFIAESISLCEVGDNAFSTKGQVLKVGDADTNYLAFGLKGEIVTGVVDNQKLSDKVELPYTRIVYDNAFADQTFITGFEGPNVACIGVRAFKNCSSLEELKIPNIGIIKSEAFLACTKLNMVELGDQFSYAADDSFKNALITQTINQENTDEGVTLVGLGSDSSLKVLLSVEPTVTKDKYDLDFIPDTVITIAIGALDKLKNKISSITLSSSAVAQKLLAKQYNLTSVKIADSVKSIGADAFEDCYALETIEYEGSRLDWCNIIFENNLANPLYYTPNYKKQFKPAAEGLNLNGIALDFSGIVNIPDCTFYKCFNYTITNTEDLQEIGEYAFFESISTQTDSIGLTALDLTNSTKLQRIKKFAFAGCTALVTLKLPAVQTLVLEDFAFANVTALAQLVVNIPNISLGNYALSVSTVENATINTQLFNILLFKRVQKLTLIEDGNPIKLDNIRYLTNLQQLIFKKANQVLTEEFLSPFIGYYLAGCPALTSVSVDQDTILTKYFIENNNIIDVDNQTLLFIARASDTELTIYDGILPNGTYVTTIGPFAIGHLFDIVDSTGTVETRDNDKHLIIPTTITYIDKNAYTKVL